MRILVTGGNGFIGSHLVDRLALSAQHKVFVLDLYPRAYEALPQGVSLIPGNFGDMSVTRRILVDQGIDVVYHLAWSTIHETALENQVLDVEQNLITTLSLLDACRKAKVKQVVFTSSGGAVYGLPESLPLIENHTTNPINAYGVTKLATEKYLQMYQHLYGLDYTIFRPSVPYGPRQNPRRRQGAVSVFIYKILRGDPLPVWGDGQIMRDYFYIEDLIDALAAAIDAPGARNAIFNLAGTKTYTINQLIDKIEQSLGLSARVSYLSERKFDVKELHLDTRLASEKLGWRPKVSLGEGIQRTAEWIQQWID